MREQTRTILAELLGRYPILNQCAGAIEQAFELLMATFNGSHKVLICGNGGSAADSSHIAAELLKSFSIRRPLRRRFARPLPATVAEELEGSLPAISLPDFLAINSAFCNDRNPQFAFAQLVLGLGMPNDLLWAISTSGNSANVLNANLVARSIGMNILGLTGKTGGKMCGQCDVCICVPETETFKIQELHLPIYHGLCAMIEREFFGA